MSDDPDWKETQAKLLREIEAFARSKPDLAAINAADKPAPKAAAAPTPQSAGRPAVAAAPAQPATAPDAPPPQASGSLLERLKREAQAKRLTDSQVLANQGHVQRAISDALQSTFQYLREFCEQLNVLKPACPIAYRLLNLVQIDGLVWQEGRTDYRLVAEAKEERLLEQVTQRFRLAADRKFAIERENPAHEAFRRALIEANIAYHEEEFRNEKSRVERARYTFSGEVKAGLALIADYQAGDIRFLTRNIRRFGAVEYRVPYETLNQETFEEIGRLILGDENRIDKMFRRVA